MPPVPQVLPSLSPAGAAAWRKGWGEDGGVEHREGRRRTGEAFPALWLGWEERRHQREHARVSPLLSARSCREFNFLNPFVCCGDLNEVGGRIPPRRPPWCQSSCSASASPVPAKPGVQLLGPKADAQIWGARAGHWRGAERCWPWEPALAWPQDGGLCSSPCSKQELDAMPQLEQAAQGYVQRRLHDCRGLTPAGN